MYCAINPYFQSPTQNSQGDNSLHEIHGLRPVPALTEKQTAAWQSPTVEEFDLCMEVTAYFQPKK